MDFWRRVLRDSQTLIGKVVAIAALHKNLLNIAFMLKGVEGLSAPDLETLGTTLQPLTQDELQIDEAFTGDLRASVESKRDLLKYLSSDPSLRNLVLALMEQTTASINIFYQQTYLPAYTLSHLSAPEFYLNAQKPRSPLKFSRFNPYNLGGKIQMAQTWQLADYVGRVHDLNGIYSLVRMQLRAIASQNTDRPLTLKTLLTEPEFRNPYTHQPFDLDSANRQLSFKCFEARNRCQINY